MFINRRLVRIEWGDCDPAGIVWYPRYFGIFDACTAHLFEAAGFPKQETRRRFGITGWPMVDTRASFKLPCRFGDDIAIETRIATFGRSSFDVEHRVFNGADLAIEAWEKRVWAGPHPDDPARIKSMPIPREVIDRLSAS
jgi:4-hydroxybenzoyl-CoA thioesterase